MKVTKKMIYSTVVAMAMAIVMCMPVFAATNDYGNNVYVYLPANQVWASVQGIGRSGAYSTVSARCNSVYPTDSSLDTYTRIQCRVLNSSGTVITKENFVILSETAGNVYMNIKEGYLNTWTVYFQFRGNSSVPANAIVSYYGG